MKKYKISVIVPVYNAESRLYGLMNNLFHQRGAEDVEFIFVDDRSTDRSFAMLNDFFILKNIRILQTEKNGGPAACRNVGLDHSTGEYVCFVDDDDKVGEPFGFIDSVFSKMPELEGGFFENMFPLMGDSDIVLCRRVMIDPATGKISHCHSSIDYGQIDCERSTTYQRVMYMHGMQYIAGSLFRREMIVRHNIRFIPGTEPNEDLFFGLVAAYYAGKMTVAKNSVYGYYLWPTSLSRQEGKMEHFYNMLLHSNRRLPMLLSHFLLKDEKYNELCRFVHAFFQTMNRDEGEMYQQGIDINRYSSYDAFPEICSFCKHIDAVCEGSKPCPHTEEFKRFIAATAKKYMPKGFDLNRL